MKPAYVIAALVVGVYLAFEVTALQRAQHRFEPDHIYGRLIAARVGVERCGDAPPGQVADFEARVERVRSRLWNALAEAGPPAGSDTPAGSAADVDSVAIEAQIAALALAAERETRDTLTAAGCESFMARRLLRRHEIEARRR
jgi:hypothetical protein